MTLILVRGSGDHQLVADTFDAARLFGQLLRVVRDSRRGDLAAQSDNASLGLDVDVLMLSGVIFIQRHLNLGGYARVDRRGLGAMVSINDRVSRTIG